MFKMLQRYQLRDYKFGLIALITAASVYGIVVIGSANAAVQDKQILGLVLGLGVLVIISLIDYQWILNLYWLIYLGSVFMLLLVRLFGDETNGAKRWFELRGFRFQPSELAKILLILFFAKFIAKNADKLNTPKVLIEFIGLAAIPLLLIYKQPDLSTTIVTAAIFCVLLFVGGLSYKFIGAILAIGIPLAIVFISIVIQPDQTLISQYQQNRILSWLKPTEYLLTGAYQQQNSITAIGSGGWNGKGLYNDDVSSVKNGDFISEPQTDFIFAVIGEELGFVGCTTLVILLLVIALTCFMIARKARDLEGRLICSGMGTLIGFQSFVNISVATGLFPNTGLPLPFISYGLTSLVSLFIGMGFVMNVGLQPKKY